MNWLGCTGSPLATSLHLEFPAHRFVEMSSLADQIDRLSRHTKSIKSTALSTASSSAGVAGPFTRALLEAPLGDLIRDIDPSELGLFNLVNPTKNTHHDRDALEPEITRVEFHGATPLRRRKEETSKQKEIEPEVYAQAALKYIDR